MCDLFKGPDMPSESDEQKKLRQQQEQMIRDQQKEADAARSEEKRKRTMEAISRSSGLYGIRSLISGSGGGSGFLSKKDS